MALTYTDTPDYYCYSILATRIILHHLKAYFIPLLLHYFKLNVLLSFLQCWCPAEFPGTHVAYTNNICWISNTYYIPMTEIVPPIEQIHMRKDKELNYYQWVPVMLLVQSLLFYCPCILWRLMNGNSGINVDRIVSLGSDAQYESPENRIRTIKYLVRHMDRCLDNQKGTRGSCCVKLRLILSSKLSILCGRRYGNYLIGVYFMVKALYIANSIGQLFMLNVFLGTEYSVYGFQVSKGRYVPTIPVL